MLFSENLYDFMKKVVQVYLPGLSALYFGLAQIWGLLYAEQILGTTATVATFLGLLLGVSSKSYKAQPVTFDGEFALEDHPDGEGMKQLRLVDADLKALETKNIVIFKVRPQHIE